MPRQSARSDRQEAPLDPAGPPAKAARGRRGRTSTASDQRWREIVDAAAAVFQRKGYEAASTADVADAVGMLKGSLYYYINSKEELLTWI